MFSLVQELIKTQRELRDVKEQLQALQTDDAGTSFSKRRVPVQTVCLFVQYNGFFNQQCELRHTMTIGELLAKLRQLTGIPCDHPIRIRVIQKDGLTTLFFLPDEPERTLKSYDDRLKDQMILSIEDGEDADVDNQKEKHFHQSKSTTSSEKTYSFDESDV
ncbi:unnamed protein product [Rotaria magnacalcarata]|nr:unnamed protein product [Rotaria magnacalcarata]CAF1681457.1 unnamed protein product [Rotaria magnacalcarata]CAF1973083.1 unnamed protein product [Rotaria magnacalcarata]CAF2045683.1 unnamed protein product [Rotaria magnacalcarata]CAF2142590.1 unnamed protein product [Rotaria magnacalcarata]